jgi:hypothetical protein
MYKAEWQKLLAIWQDQLEMSFNPERVTHVHLVAEEKGKGEIHYFSPVENAGLSARDLIARAFTRFAERKLADRDPGTIRITALKWVTRRDQS